jgi:ADP-ribose pyrophosphatase YjhB (NUDIX family)
MVSSKHLYPFVVVDIALFSMEAGRLRVLLVQRSQEPEARSWALPGGVLKPELDESLEAAARRVLREKVSVDVPHLEEVCSFSGPDRDPRGWSISMLYCALLPRDKVNALVRSKVEAVEWVDVLQPVYSMAFDHELMLASALRVLRDKVERHALPLHLLPERFTLSELQRTCEAILGRPLDKSVFRRRLKASTDLVPLEEYVRGSQRPALLYRAPAGFVF